MTPKSWVPRDKWQACDDATRHAGLPLVPYSAVSSTLTSAPQASSLQTCMPSPVQVMGCCWGVPDPPEVAFDPVIGLSDKLKAGGVQVQGNVVSGNGSILGDSPVLQDKVTIVHLEGCLVHPLQLCRPSEVCLVCTLCTTFAGVLRGDHRAPRHLCGRTCYQGDAARLCDEPGACYRRTHPYPPASPVRLPSVS
jgi:hypothetical protein